MAGGQWYQVPFLLEAAVVPPASAIVCARSVEVWRVFIVPTDVQIKAIVGLVIAVVAVVFLVHGVYVAPGVLNSAFSWAVAVVAFALLLWERWLWSWRVFRPWLTRRPDLRGTWKGH